MITYRFLTSLEERAKIEHVFAENGGEMPDPQYSAIAGAFNDDGDIVGFHVLNLVPHLEPLWVHPDYRSKVNWREFQRMLESSLQGGSYYIFPSDERIANLCKRGGMTEVPMKAYVKELK